MCESYGRETGKILGGVSCQEAVVLGWKRAVHAGGGGGHGSPRTGARDLWRTGRKGWARMGEMGLNVRGEGGTFRFSDGFRGLDVLPLGIFVSISGGWDLGTGGTGVEMLRRNITVLTC